MTALSDQEATEKSPLAGRRVFLRRIEAEDVPFLAALGVAESESYRWRWRGTVPSEDEVRRALSAGVLIQFIAADRRDGRPIGHVFAYDEDHLVGSVWLAMAVVPELRARGLGLEAAEIFLDHLFDSWPFELVLGETPEFNYQQFGSAEGVWFERLGTLREHTYFRGRWWDSAIVGVTRARWQRQRRERLQKHRRWPRVTDDRLGLLR